MRHSIAHGSEDAKSSFRGASRPADPTAPAHASWPRPGSRGLLGTGVRADQSSVSRAHPKTRQATTNSVSATRALSISPASKYLKKNGTAKTRVPRTSSHSFEASRRLEPSTRAGRPGPSCLPLGPCLTERLCPSRTTDTEMSPASRHSCEPSSLHPATRSRAGTSDHPGHSDQGSPQPTLPIDDCPATRPRQRQ